MIKATNYSNTRFFSPPLDSQLRITFSLMPSTGDNINLPYLFSLCENPRALHERLVEWKLIPREGDLPCPRCGNFFKLRTSNCRADRLMWICSAMVSLRKKKRKPCGNTQTYRTGTIFTRSKLSLMQLLCFAHMWVERCELRFISKTLEIDSPHTIVKWAATCREIVLDSMIQATIELGGEGVVVELMENRCNRRTSQDQAADGLWIYAGYERSTGRVFMVLVENRSPEALLAVIKKWIVPGTTVVADFWRAYDCLDSEDYRQLAADHSLTFDYLNSGRKKTNAAGDLAVHLFLKQCRLLKIDSTIEFYRLAGLVCDPQRPDDISVEPDMTGYTEEMEFDHDD